MGRKPFFLLLGLIGGLSLRCSKSSESSSSGPHPATETSSAITGSASTSEAKTPPATSNTATDTATTPAPAAVAQGDPTIIQLSQHLGTRATYLTTRLNELGGPLPQAAISNLIWKCPGDSILTGMQATYANKDRKFQLACSFLEDGQGRPISRETCNTSSASTGNVDFTLACPDGTFPAGLQSTKLATDRSFQFYCCELANVEGKKVITPNIDRGDGLGPRKACDDPMAGLAAKLYGLLPNRQVNDAGDTSTPLSYTCPIDAQQGETNKVLTGFSTEYYKDDQDRRWGFDCCQLGFSDTKLGLPAEGATAP